MGSVVFCTQSLNKAPHAARQRLGTRRAASSADAPLLLKLPLLLLKILLACQSLASTYAPSHPLNFPKMGHPSRVSSSLGLAVLVVLGLAASADGDGGQAAAAGAAAEAQQQRGGISSGAQRFVLCSLGLTLFVVVGHVLRGGASSRGGADVPVGTAAVEPAASGGDGAGTEAGPRSGPVQPTDTTLEGLRRRSAYAGQGREGSKPASLPLHKLIEASDTAAVQSFAKRNSPELVRELFNTGDPALNGTTPLLLALRLGEDAIATLLLVRCIHAQLPLPGQYHP